MGLTLVTAASGPPLTAANLRAHCSIAADDTSFDGLLTDYIAAATAMAQDFTGKAIGAQTWLLSIDAFTHAIELPRGPVTGSPVITYIDTAGAVQTLSSGVYLTDLISEPQRVVLAPNQSWPATQTRVNAVTITFGTGFASPPATILQAIRMTVSAWFTNREAGEIPETALALLRPLRRVKI